MALVFSLARTTGAASTLGMVLLQNLSPAASILTLSFRPAITGSSVYGSPVPPQPKTWAGRLPIISAMPANTRRCSKTKLARLLSAVHLRHFRARKRFHWNDLFRIIAAISKVLANTDDTIERRWRKVLFLVATLRQAKFDGGGDPEKAVTGDRLSELLHILTEAAEDDVPQLADQMPRPGWVGRMVFRPIVALYYRKDTGPDRGSAQVGLLGRLFSGIQFARGKGSVPRVHAAIPVATFADTDKPLGKLSERAVSMLTRWAQVKVESGQFCGPTNFGLGVWDGLESLAMTFPAAMWLARLLVAGGRASDEAIALAVRIVDDNFGFNKLLGSARQKFALRLLAARGELPKLIAWYGR